MLEFAFQLRQGFVDGTGINSGALLGGHEVTALGARVVLSKDGTYHTVLECASWGTQYGVNGIFDLDLQASFGTVASKADFLSGCIRQGEVGSRLSNFRFSQAQSGSSNRQSACQQQFSKHNVFLLSTSYFYIDAQDLLKVSI